MSNSTMASALSVVILGCYQLLLMEATGRRFGPYDWVLEKLDRCPDSGTDESVFPTRLTKVSRNRAVLNDSFQLRPTVDEDSAVEVEIQEWGNQGYRPRSYQFMFKTCANIWNETGPNVKKLFQSTGVNITGCPIPAGNYSSENIVLDFKISKMPVMMYNKYRVLISLFYSKKKVGCCRFYMEAVPKL